jgi:phasin
MADMTKPVVPEAVRDAAEKTLSQAREAVGKYMQEAARMQDQMISGAQKAQEGGKEMGQKVASYAQANINAAFDFAQALVRAKTPQEIAQIQQKFAQEQVSNLTSQMKELGGAAAQAMKPQS